MRTPRHLALLSGIALGFALVVLSVGPRRSADAGTAFRFAAATDLATGDTGSGTGAVDMRTRLARSGRESARIDVRTTDLVATRDGEGRLPEYGVFVTPPGEAEIFLGALRVDGRGRGRLRVRRAAERIAAAGLSARAFPGGSVEVRNGATVLLRGALPAATMEGATAALDRRQVYGRFVAISAPKSAPGSFALRTDERGSGEIRSRLTLRAPGLPTGASPPTYTARIINEAGNRVVTLGNLDREPLLGAALRLDSRRAALAGGILRWSEFDGGRLEVLRGGTIMLRGHVAPLRGVGESIEDVGLARARRSAPLVATPAGGSAQAILTAAARSGPQRRDGEIRLRALDLAPARGPFSVTATDDNGTTRDLGSFETRGDAGIGRLRVSTRSGDSIPGGNVVRLGGQAVRVRDALGAVVLTGSFPLLD